jgi:hypothetical protein
MYGSVTNIHVKENPCMVLIPSSVLKHIGKILFDETLYVNIAIAYFQKQNKIPYGWETIKCVKGIPEPPNWGLVLCLAQDGKMTWYADWHCFSLQTTVCEVFAHFRVVWSNIKTEQGGQVAPKLYVLPVTS